jgi:hypothetical protein
MYLELEEFIAVFLVPRLAENRTYSANLLFEGARISQLTYDLWETKYSEEGSLWHVKNNVISLEIPFFIVS